MPCVCSVRVCAVWDDREAETESRLKSRPKRVPEPRAAMQKTRRCVTRPTGEQFHTSKVDDRLTPPPKKARRDKGARFYLATWDQDKKDTHGALDAAQWEQRLARYPEPAQLLVRERVAWSGSTDEFWRARMLACLQSAWLSGQKGASRIKLHLFHKLERKTHVLREILGWIGEEPRPVWVRPALPQATLAEAAAASCATSNERLQAEMRLLQHWVSVVRTETWGTEEQVWRRLDDSTSAQLGPAGRRLMPRVATYLRWCQRAGHPPLESVPAYLDLASDERKEKPEKDWQRVARTLTHAATSSRLLSQCL